MRRIILAAFALLWAVSAVSPTSAEIEPWWKAPCAGCSSQVRFAMGLEALIEMQRGQEAFRRIEVLKSPISSSLKSYRHYAGSLTLLGAGGPSGAVYQGPIDINGTAFAFWSTRCGAKLYSGNILDIWDSPGNTTETVLGCDGAGNIVVKSGSALATTCSGTCRVKTIYDQSGSNNCSGPCDVTQATDSKRATYTISLLGGKGGLTFASASTQCYPAVATQSSSPAQPVTLSVVFNSSAGSTAHLYGDTGTAVEFYTNGSNSLNTYAGGAANDTVTANDNASHAGQSLLNGASSFISVDGTNGATASIGAGAPSGTMIVGAFSATACTTQPYNGNWFEFGIWASDKTANNATMNSNQHTYWGF